MRKLILLFCLATPAYANDSISISAGGLVSLTEASETQIEPFAEIRTQTNLTTWNYSPTLHVQLNLLALPGSEISLESVSMVRSIEASIGVSQRIHDTVRIEPYIEGGFSTKLPDGQVLANKTANWTAIGIRLSVEKGWVAITANADQRLDGLWHEAIAIKGSVQLTERLGMKMNLTGNAILGAERSVVRIAIAIGR